MKKIEIAIFDDEIKHIAFTKELIEAIMKKTDHPYAISSFVTLETLLSGKKRFDIAIMDIEYGNENGIEVAKSLNTYPNVVSSSCLPMPNTPPTSMKRNISGMS